MLSPFRQKDNSVQSEDVGGIKYCVGVYMISRVDGYFFFSSRRRHTRLQGDWSSDVCSSDLQPVRMSKRRGEFVLMEELLEEVGRDAARFTFLTRRHDSPLEFDLAVATRQSSDNPVYYVQYAHARIRSIHRQVAEQGIAVPAWRDADLTPLARTEEQALIQRLPEYPNLAAGAPPPPHPPPPAPPARRGRGGGCSAFQ